MPSGENASEKAESREPRLRQERSLAHGCDRLDPRGADCGAERREQRHDRPEQQRDDDRPRPEDRARLRQVEAERDEELVEQLRQPEAWLAAIESAGTAIDEEIPVTPDSAVEEMVMMGLRLVNGASRPRLEALADADVETLLGPRLTRLIEGGFLTLDNDRLAATEAGRQRLNAVLGALFA